MRDVYVSGYRKPNRTLLVVANLSREDRSGTVTVSADTLGHAAQRVTYWVTKEALSMARSDLRVTVPRQGYRMLRVEP
jgi:O-glycosyl hydrolase